MRGLVIGVAVLFALFVSSCKPKQPPQPAALKGATDMGLEITSSAFKDGQSIPRKFTCDGEDVSPPLAWTGVPAAAKSLALICDDPDAPMGTWTHWVLWGMPPSTPALPEGVPKDATLPGLIKQGQNSWPRTGYNGPCPPPGKPHRYFFKLYALDTELSLADNANKAALDSAMKGHILAQDQLMGTYGRQ